MFVFYDESILSYVSSIRDYFGLTSSYKPNIKFKEILNKEKPNKVFLVLIDGMGANILERYLDKDSFFRKHLLYKVQTVYPTTTTAALTSIQNGKAPNENAWIAWNEYIKDEDDYIVPFQNIGYYSKKEYGEGYISKKYPVVSTVTELTLAGVKAMNIIPNFSDENRNDRIIPNSKKFKKTSIEELCEKIIEIDKTSDCKYIFGYYDGLDHIMHHNGPSSKVSIDLLKHIDDTCMKMSSQLNDDTMIIFVADHGQIDVNEIIELQGSKYDKYMRRKTYIEPRAVGFDIYEDKKEEFEKMFTEEYENDFILLTRKQVIDNKLFGYNDNNPQFIELLPDYLALGKTNKLMYSEYPDTDFKGHHTGISDDEMFVPIIVYKKNKL